MNRKVFCGNALRGGGDATREQESARNVDAYGFAPHTSSSLHVSLL
jgi:hypothetical protein